MEQKLSEQQVKEAAEMLGGFVNDSFAEENQSLKKKVLELHKTNLKQREEIFEFEFQIELLQEKLRALMKRHVRLDQDKENLMGEVRFFKNLKNF
jgi:hypothetical protein